MSNRPKSVYLTDRSMSAVRPPDSLSGRVNQIVDRYLEIVRSDGQQVREMFIPIEWAALVRFRDDTGEVRADGLRMALARYMSRLAAEDDALIDGPGLIDRLTAGDVMVLAELLEAEGLPTTR